MYQIERIHIQQQQQQHRLERRMQHTPKTYEISTKLYGNVQYFNDTITTREQIVKESKREHSKEFGGRTMDGKRGRVGEKTSREVNRRE